jgi:hypothetical protein
MTEPTARPPFASSTPEPSGSGVQRRTLVRGAAWSVPAIAVAAGAPAFAASPSPWNIAVDGGCFLDLSAATTNLFPSWTVKETTGNTPASPLSFYEEFGVRYAIAGSNNIVSKLAAQAIITGLITSTLPQWTAAAIGGFLVVPVNTNGTWTIPAFVSSFGTDVLWDAATSSWYVDWKFYRNPVLSGLAAGGSASYIYLGAFQVPEVNIIGLVMHPYWTLTALAGSGGANTADDADAIDTATIIGGC